MGGGGLLAGSCLTASYLAPNIQMIGAEPSTKADLKKSLQNQKHTPCVFNYTFLIFKIFFIDELIYI